jgi:phage-related minor tail protein
MQIAELTVGVKASLSDFNNQMSGLKSQLGNMQKSFESTGKNLSKYVTAPIVALGGGLLALSATTAEYADKLYDLKSATGHSTEAIQEWQAVADRARTNTDAVTNASQALTRAMTRGEEGSADMRRAIESLGLSFEELKNSNPDKRMSSLISSLQNVESESQRAMLGNQLFRGSYEELAPILGMTEEKMKSVIDIARESGKIMGEDALRNADVLGEGIERLKTEFAGLGRTIMEDFIPILVEDFIPFVEDTVIPVIRNFAKFIASLIGVFNELSPVTQKIIVIITGLFTILGPVLLVIGKIVSVVQILAPAFAALSGPIGWVVLAIGALIAIGVALVKNWDKIKEFALSVGQAIIDSWTELWEFMKSLPEKFFEAGKNIMESIKEGIKEKAKEVVDAMKDTMEKVRDYLPFSPAKEGPLKDLNKLNFGGTIAEGIYSGANEVTAAMNHTLQTPSISGAGAGGTNVYIELDGRTIASSLGNPLVGEIRARTGLKI